jgi:Protein of unknown function (DUF3301)
MFPSAGSRIIDAMSSLALLVLIGLLVWFWQESLKSRDIASQVARASCSRQELQLLDGTVSLQTLRFFYRNRDDYGLKRTYAFDYSGDGISRQTGCVVLYNNRVASIVLAHV